MTGASLQFEVDFRPWTAQLAEGERRTGDLVGLHGAIAEVLVTAVKHNFETSGDGAWPPLKPETLLARAREALGPGASVTKRKKGGGRTLRAAAVRAIADAKPLIKSAAGLYQTIAPEATEAYAAAGSPLDYAAHQFFGSKPEWPWHLPARNPLYLHPEEEIEIGRMYVEFFRGAFA